jgi:hypothetical protein
MAVWWHWHIPRGGLVTPADDGNAAAQHGRKLGGLSDTRSPSFLPAWMHECKSVRVPTIIGIQKGLVLDSVAVGQLPSQVYNSFGISETTAPVWERCPSQVMELR